MGNKDDVSVRKLLLEFSGEPGEREIGGGDEDEGNKSENGWANEREERKRIVGKERENGEIGKQRKGRELTSCG